MEFLFHILSEEFPCVSVLPCSNQIGDRDTALAFKCCTHFSAADDTEHTDKSRKNLRYPRYPRLKNSKCKSRGDRDIKKVCPCLWHVRLSILSNVVTELILSYNGCAISCYAVRLCYFNNFFNYSFFYCYCVGCFCFSVSCFVTTRCERYCYDSCCHQN